VNESPKERRIRPRPVLRSLYMYVSFDRATLRRAQLCHAKFSVRPTSVCNVQVRWSHSWNTVFRK